MPLRVYRAAKPALAALLAGCLSSPSPSGDHDAAVVDAAIDADSDANCDGDGDGYLATGCAGAAVADCRDDVASIHPGAYDAPDNDVDEDCLDGDAVEADSIRPNQTTTGANGINFINDFVQARLGAARGYTLDELGGTTRGEPNSLYTGSEAERYVGVHVWQTFFSYATQTVPTPQMRADGRAAVQIAVPSWQAFGMSQVGMEGTTIYTVFPDGRVHIDHDFEVLATNGSNFNTAYVALDPTAIDNVVWTVDGGGTATVGSLASGMTIAHSAQTDDPTGYLCGYQSVGGLVVGLGYHVPGTPRAGSRITENNGGVADDHWIALQYDFTYSAAVPLGDVSGDFLVYVGDGGPGTPCDPVQARVQPWLNPAAVSVTAPGVLQTTMEGDGNGDGYVEGGGYYALDAQGGQEVAMTFDTAGGRAAPATSSYRIEGLDLTHDPTVLLDGVRLGHGEQYLLQVEGTVAWLYLGIPVANASQLTIRAP